MKYIVFSILCLGIGALLLTPKYSKGMDVADSVTDQKPDNLPVATFAGGCFWCTESEFRALDGVVYTEVGYTGGQKDDPAYEDITTGRTGHAEAINIYYDPEKTSYDDLLMFFLTKAHDPTQLNRQGVDVGTQYRSAVFYHDEAQKNAAQKAIDAVNAQNIYNDPVVTTLEPATIFWLGEDYHQQYYEKYKERTGNTHIRVMMKSKK